MNQIEKSSNQIAVLRKKELDKKFFRKGILTALSAGIWYGLYSAFMTLGMTKGVWSDWYGPNKTGLSIFVITYLLGALGSAVNDICSSIWAIISSSINGKFKDFLRTINTSPGRIMILAALIGGPIANTAYVISIQLAGSIVIPIAALNPAIGAILARILFKQKLNKRMLLGIAICISAGFIIGNTAISGDSAENMLLGLCISFLAAICWGFEGCVAGYGTSMIDSEIGITIRQTTSGISNLIILIPILGIISGSIKTSNYLTIQAFTSSSAMIWFIISGFCSFISFMFWYRGNSMCGAALGMACSSTYSFWGPFFSWIVLGVFGGMDGWKLAPIAWIGAIIMIFGIFIIATNPLDLFRRKFK